MKLKGFFVRYSTPAASVLIAGISLAVLLSWIMNVPAAFTLMQNSIPMPPVAAVLCLLLSPALVFMRSKDRAMKKTAAVLAVIVIAVLIVQTVFLYGAADAYRRMVLQGNFMFGIPIGHMSPIGIGIVALIALAVLLESLSYRTRRIVDTAALLAMIAACIITTGYWYGAPFLYGGSIIPVPFVSASVFIMAAFAVLMAKPDALFARILTGQTVFASLIRYLVPAITIVVLFIGWHESAITIKMAKQAGVIVNSIMTLLAIALLVFVSVVISRRVGRKLEESENRLAATLRSIGDGVISTDDKGNVIAPNSVAEKLTGWETREAFEKPLGEVFPIINAQTRDIAENPVARVLKEGIVVGLANHTALIAKDGTERQIADSAAPIRDGEGKIIGTVLVFRDVTDEYAMREAVAKSEAQYRKLFSEMISAFAYHEIICDADGKPVDYRFLAVNEAFERLTGFPRDSIIGKTVLEVMPGTESVWIENYGRVALSGEPMQFENYAAEIGKYYEVRAYSPKRGTFAVMFQDITEKKRMDSEREATIEILRLINSRNNSHELIQAVTGYLKEWSGCEAVGIRLKDGDDYPYFETRGFPAEFVAMENTLCERDLSGQVKRDDIGNPVLDCMCGNILAGRFDPSKPFFTEHGSFWSNCTTELLASTTEADRQARTRNRCNAEGYESVALIPLRYVKGTLGLIQINDHRRDRFSEVFIGMLERMADSLAIALTQRNAERSLRENETMLQCLWKISQFRAKSVQEILDFTLTESVALSGSTIGYIYHYDEEKKEFTLNSWSRDVMKECRIMEPQTVYQLDKTGIWGEAVRQRKAVIDNDFSRPNPLRKGYPQGHVHLDTFMSVPIFSGEKIVAVAGVGNKKSGYSDSDVQMLSHLMDSAWKIVERFEAMESVKKHEEALMQADKLQSLGVLATGIVHEINQPLMAISMALDILALKAGDGAYTAVKVASMKEYVSRITKIVDEVRTFAREKHDDTGTFSMNTAVRNVLGMIGTQLKGHTIRVIESLDEAMPTVTGDLYRFEQVVLNIVTNARYAVETCAVKPEGAEISIRTYSNGRKAIMQIRDNGAGIPEGVKRNLFTPFYTTKPVGDGTGLGLSIAYGIIKSMGGDIDVVSEEGRFTEFTITLPVRQE